MNSKNSKISYPHKLFLNLTDKIHFKRKDKYIALSNLCIYYTWKNITKPYKNNKISAPTWNEEFVSYRMNDILYQIFNFFWKKIAKFLNDAFQSYYNRFQVNWLVQN